MHKRDGVTVRLGSGVRTNPRIVVLCDVAVEAKDLQIGRESFPLDSDIELLTNVFWIAAFFRSVVIDMIQRQKRRIRFEAAHAGATIMCENRLFPCPRSLPLIMNRTQTAREVGAVAAFRGTNNARMMQSDEWIAVQPPTSIMHCAPSPRLAWIVAAVDDTILIHNQLHFSITQAQLEIKL